MNFAAPAGAVDGRGGTTPHQRKDLLLYAAVVLGVSTLTVASFPLLHVTNNWAANALMFIPGLAALLFRLRRREGFQSVGWRTGSLLYWFWGIVLPIIVMAISLPVSIRLGYAALAAPSTPIGGLVSHPVKILENMLIYTLISIPFAFGEEFGWRGYAQGKLVREFGLVPGLLLLGLMWGFWHTPIYYFTGTYPEHKLLGPFVMTPIDNILAVVPMAWLYIRSRNIWVPTFTHAFADILWGFSSLIFPPTQEIKSWAVLQTMQLIVSIVLLMDLRSRTFQASAKSSFLTEASS